MFATVFQKVYDEVMATPQQCDLDGRKCDVCDKSGSGQDMFILPGDRFLNFDVCDSCRANAKLESIMERTDCTHLTEEEQPCRWRCDVCSKKLGGGCAWYFNRRLDLDMCDDCYGCSNMLLTTRRVSPEIRTAKRGLRLKFVDPATIDYTRPHSISFNTPEHACTLERAEEWANEWSCLVRVPENFVWMEWTRCADWHEMKYYPAWTSLAVRCVYGKELQVASLCKDSEGRISVDVVFDNLQSFLEDRDKFRVRMEQAPPQIFEILDKYHLEHNRFRDSLMVASQEYSEFIRLEKGLPFTFRW